jgi:ubiquinone/menaquinone biosynthesis C-methylase UbiE
MPVTVAERTRRVYDRVAAVYPVSTFFFHSKAHRRALKNSGIRDGMKVLEVATGSGEMFRRLARANRHGTTLGFDLSPAMAARTQRRVSRRFPHSWAQCHAVDARYMPFPDKTFDALVCCYLLELLSLDDVERTIGEFHRVLKEQATLTLVLIGRDGGMFNHIYRTLGKLVPAFWGRQVDDRVREMIQARDFRIVSVQRVRQSFYPSDVLVARK